MPIKLGDLVIGLTHFVTNNDNNATCRSHDIYACVGLSTQAFFSLDEAIASRAVFVIASGSDGRTETLFWSQLNNTKTVSDRPYVSLGIE